MNNLLQTNNLLRIGIIGCGRAAEIIYSHALKKSFDVKVTAVLDPIKERRELLSKNFNYCSTFDSLKPDFFDEIDAGIITSPPDSHISLASELLKRDKYVLVEKPLATSMDAIKELIKIESTSKASLIMGFNLRYWQPVIQLRERLISNPKINSVEINFAGNYSKWNPVSFVSDPVNDLGSHVFDLIRFLLNKEIISVSANDSEMDQINLEIKMSDTILVHSNLSHSGKSERSIKVISDAGKFFITLNSVRISEYNQMRKFLDTRDMIKRKLHREPSPIKSTYETQLGKFFDSIRLNKIPHPGIEDGIKAIVAVEAAYRSVVNHGKEIFLNEIY